MFMNSSQSSSLFGNKKIGSLKGLASENAKHATADDYLNVIEEIQALFDECHVVNKNESVVNICQFDPKKAKEKNYFFTIESLMEPTHGKIDYRKNNTVQESEYINQPFLAIEKPIIIEFCGRLGVQLDPGDSLAQISQKLALSTKTDDMIKMSSRIQDGIHFSIDYLPELSAAESQHVRINPAEFEVSVPWTDDGRYVLQHLFNQITLKNIEQPDQQQDGDSDQNREENYHIREDMSYNFHLYADQKINGVNTRNPLSQERNSQKKGRVWLDAIKKQKESLLNEHQKLIEDGGVDPSTPPPTLFIYYMHKMAMNGSPQTVLNFSGQPKKSRSRFFWLEDGVLQIEIKKNVMRK